MLQSNCIGEVSVGHCGLIPSMMSSLLYNPSMHALETTSSLSTTCSAFIIRLLNMDPISMPLSRNIVSMSSPMFDGFAVASRTFSRRIPLEAASFHSLSEESSTPCPFQTLQSRCHLPCIKLEKIVEILWCSNPLQFVHGQVQNSCW